MNVVHSFNGIYFHEIKDEILYSTWLRLIE